MLRRCVHVFVPPPLPRTHAPPLATGDSLARPGASSLCGRRPVHACLYPCLPLCVCLCVPASARQRGCFLYGNHILDLDLQVRNWMYAYLVALNSQFLDLGGCNFSAKNMKLKDRRDHVRVYTCAAGLGRGWRVGWVCAGLAVELT